MKLFVDQEGRSTVEQLCDIALKQCGVQNLSAVNKILASVVLLPTPVPPVVKEPICPKSLDEETAKAADEKQEEVKEEAEAETKEAEAETKEEPKEMVEEVKTPKFEEE